jgi:hypothetical protein
MPRCLKVEVVLLLFPVRYTVIRSQSTAWKCHTKWHRQTYLGVAKLRRHDTLSPAQQYGHYTNSSSYICCSTKQTESAELSHRNPRTAADRRLMFSCGVLWNERNRHIETCSPTGQQPNVTYVLTSQTLGISLLIAPPSQPPYMTWADDLKHTRNK